MLKSRRVVIWQLESVEVNVSRFGDNKKEVRVAAIRGVVNSGELTTRGREPVFLTI